MPGRLLSFLAGGSNQQKRMVDVILMSALASEGTLTQETLDRIARALQSNSEFSGVSWEWVLARADELALDAPLFSDARAALSSELPDPFLRRSTLALAAKIAISRRALGEAQRAILHELGVAFDIFGADLDELLVPGDDPEPGFLRSAYNDPAEGAPSLFDAMAQAKTDAELRLFSYKLCALRRILDELLPGSTLASVGEVLEMGSHAGRVDAVIDVVDAGRCIVRCLAHGEALHPGEHRLLGGLAAELKELSFLMIAHQGPIPLMDQAFIRELDPTKLRVEKVDIWEAVP